MCLVNNRWRECYSTVNSSQFLSGPAHLLWMSLVNTAPSVSAGQTADPLASVCERGRGMRETSVVRLCCVCVGGAARIICSSGHFLFTLRCRSISIYVYMYVYLDTFCQGGVFTFQSLTCIFFKVKDSSPFIRILSLIHSWFLRPSNPKL